jgi:hypothetical protein
MADYTRTNIAPDRMQVISGAHRIRPLGGLLQHHPTTTTQKKPASGGFFLFNFRFLIKHMFACFGIVLLGLHLFRMQPFVLGGCVEVTGTGTGDESDFFTH